MVFVLLDIVVAVENGAIRVSPSLKRDVVSPIHEEEKLSNAETIEVLEPPSASSDTQTLSLMVICINQDSILCVRHSQANHSADDRPD